MDKFLKSKNKQIMKTLLLTICISMIFLLLLKHNKQDKYEYHVIVTIDSVFIYNHYNEYIGQYEINPKQKFDSILILDNL